MNKIFFLSIILFLSFVSCKNNKKKDFTIVQSSESIDYSSPDYIKYEFEKVNKKIDVEISSKNNHYTWMAGVTCDSLNGSLIFGPIFTNNLFLISKLKLTKCNGGYKVEGVICNISPCDISNIKIASAIMLNLDKATLKDVRSSSKMYTETLKSGSANSFSIKVSTIENSYVNSISNVDKLYKEGYQHFDSSKSLHQKSKIDAEFSDVGICIEEYVIHYNSFGGKNELIDKNYLLDTIFNYPSISEMFSGISDFRNDDEFENLNSLGEYEFEGIGKIESKFSRIKEEEKWKARREQAIARNKSYADNIGKKFVDARNPALAYGNFEFDPLATNFERFKNSPCYSKLGFDPIQALKDSIGLEKEYQACEKEYRIKKNTKMFIYFFTAFMLLIITMVLFKKYYKKRID
jgi:hypothetical protein